MYQQSYQSGMPYAGSGSIGGTDVVRRSALRLYRWERCVGAARRLWARLTGRQHDLLDLKAARRIDGAHSVAIQAVPLAAVRGSEGRCNDFDAGFCPRQEHSRDRWVGVATARLQGVMLPRVLLIQVGEDYYVRDGHHRISVARALGEAYIDAEVI